MKNVLVVDNNPVMIKFMTNLIEKEGHHLVAAGDGLSALEILKSYQPDIIFLDWIMPNIAGDKLCRIIRSIPGFKDVYMVVLSAIAAEEEIDFVEAGADACIAKGPFNKIADHITVFLDQLQNGTLDTSCKKVLGLENLYQRDITKELVFSKKHTEVILDNMAEGILELTHQSLIIYVNPTAVTLIGIPEEKLLASNFTDLFDRNQRDKINRLLTASRKTPCKVGEQAPVILNGRPLTVHALPVTAEKHKAVIIILNDISEHLDTKKALLDSEKKYRLLADNTLDCIWLMDLDFQFTYVNPAVEEIFGYLPDEWIKTKLSAHCTDEEAKKIYAVLSEELNNIKDHQGMVFETRFLHKNGETIPVEINGKILFDAHRRPIGLQGSTRDISQRKKAERELQESLDTLKLAQNQLIQSEKLAALGDLVAGVAHEINTPLGAGITAASFLEEKVKKYKGLYDQNRLKRSDLEKFIQRTSEAASIIHTNLINATDRIKSLKQVAADQSSEKKRTFRVKENIDELLLSLYPKYKRTQHKITVNCPPDLQITSYPGAFTQIISNFVINSLIHGFEIIEKGHITLKIDDASDSLELCYSDDGIGMDSNTVKRVFDPFFTTKRNQGGTGLGLHIVYTLVTQTLGGTIECKSIPDKGTTFLINIPIQHH